MSYTAQIEAQYLAARTNWKEDHRIRVHRAISWLKASEKYAGEDIDVAFLAAVNAANACWAVNRAKDRESIDHLVEQLRGTESLKKITMMLASKEGTEWANMMIGNKYFYPEYAEYVRGEMSEDAWLNQATKNHEKAQNAFDRKHFDTVLAVVLKQLVSQRAQVAHGYTTYESSANRKPLKMTTTMLAKIVGQILLEMIKSPQKDWGDMPYLFKDEKYKGTFKKA